MARWALLGSVLKCLKIDDDALDAHLQGMPSATTAATATGKAALPPAYLQPQRAVDLAQAALKLDARNILALFVLGSSQAALSAHAAAAAAFRHVVQQTAGAEPGSQRHQLHLVAAENLLLECDRAMPVHWIAALHDAPRLAVVQRSVAAAVAQCLQPARVLVCGGMGLEAVMAVQAGAEFVTVYCHDNPLAASLATELAAGSGCGDRLTTAATIAELQQQLRPGAAGHTLLVLADALGSNIGWQHLAVQLQATAPLLAPGVAVLPHAVHVHGCLVHCPRAVALNEVDVAALQANTGGLDLAAANLLLPRGSRSARLSTYPHTALTDSRTLLTLPMAALLPTTLNANGDSSTPAQLEAAARLQVGTAGAADALCWWYEQLLLADAGAVGGTTASLLRLSADPSACPAGGEELVPHVWQHLQYLDHRRLEAGQVVEVRCRLAGTDGTAVVGVTSLSLWTLHLAECGTAEAAGGKALSLQFDVRLSCASDGGSGNGGSDTSSGRGSLLLEVPHPSIAAAVPTYHVSMLNDSCRTAVYRDGITTALQQAAGSVAAAAADAAGAPPLVLEIGSGSGLLCMLACQAGAPSIVGCERLPELQAVAGQLLAANDLANRVTILPKLSKALSVAAAGGGTAVADLPRRADVLLHEIFGTDPFSEGVVPTLLHAKQYLLQPGAVLAPCKLHVVAAVVASTRSHRLLRPPTAVCGGRICTAVLRQLAPRKVDCQAGEAQGLFLLTEPAYVLSVDFESDELALVDSSTALLECLPWPLSLVGWMAVHKAAAEGHTGAGDASDSNGQAREPAEVVSLEGAALGVLSWFEYEFAGGVVGSTAPHRGGRRTEHWQQMVQPLEGAAADTVLASLQPCSSGSSRDGAATSGGIAALLLTAGYQVDRLWFELAGIAAAAQDSGSSEDDS